MEPTTPYQSITLDHLVEFKNDDCVFGAGRDEVSGKTQIFLIFNHSGRVYSRNGKADSWEALGKDEATLIRHLAAQSGIPRYQARGSFSNI